MIDLQQFKDKTVHFIGIGGCSMSGLAVILKKLGLNPRGSDINESAFTRKLESEGIPYTIGHKAENVTGASLVVYSAAIKPDNDEYARAKQLGLPMLQRSELLGLISRQYDNVICIAGCHGKTTITSMTALILRECGIYLNIHVGGMVDFLGGGVAVGNYPAFLTEACEYVRSFLELRPTYALVNNIDDDHLDYYKDIEDIYGAFLEFVSMIPDFGKLFVYAHDPLTIRLADESGKRYITYGFEEADYMAENVEYDDTGCPSFDVVHPGGSARVSLPVVGRHNIVNALGAMAVCSEVFGLKVPDMARA
jgi:UDP-N-acetylmuramate--alanine ligase